VPLRFETAAPVVGGLFCIFTAVGNVRLCPGRKEDLRHGSSALRTVRASDGNKA
jgi:hypothetical protein